MKAYKDMTREELLELKAQLEKEYKEEEAKGLKLNMARGKPGPEQLDLTMPLLNALPADADPISESGDDCRNYGLLSGITESDWLAFPYGKNVKEGAQTYEGSAAELYNY